MPGVYLFTNLGHVLEGRGSLSEFSRNTGRDRCHFPPLIPSETHSHLWEPEQHGQSLHNLLILCILPSAPRPQPCPASLLLGGSALSNLPVLVLVTSGPHSRPGQTLLTTHTQPLCTSVELLLPVCSWPEPIQSRALRLAVYKQLCRRPAPLQGDACPWEKGR